MAAATSAATKAPKATKAASTQGFYSVELSHGTYHFAGVVHAEDRATARQEFLNVLRCDSHTMERRGLQREHFNLLTDTIPDGVVYDSDDDAPREEEPARRNYPWEVVEALEKKLMSHMHFSQVDFKGGGGGTPLFLRAPGLAWQQKHDAHGELADASEYFEYLSTAYTRSQRPQRRRPRLAPLADVKSSGEFHAPHLILSVEAGIVGEQEDKLVVHVAPVLPDLKEFEDGVMRSLAERGVGIDESEEAFDYIAHYAIIQPPYVTSVSFKWKDVPHAERNHP